VGLRRTLARYMDAVGGLLPKRVEPAAPQDPEGAELLRAVEDAHREWQRARTYFDTVTDPRLVDYAIFSIGAAERRYMFLLDEARKRGLHVEPRLDDLRRGARY